MPRRRRAAAGILAQVLRLRVEMWGVAAARIVSGAPVDPFTRKLTLAPLDNRERTEAEKKSSL